jgi:hypothetical protein
MNRTVDFFNSFEPSEYTYMNCSENQFPGKKINESAQKHLEKDIITEAYLEFMKYPFDFDVDTTVVDLLYGNMFGNYLDRKKELKDLYSYMQLDLERAPTNETKKTRKAPKPFSE